MGNNMKHLWIVLLVTFVLIGCNSNSNNITEESEIEVSSGLNGTFTYFGSLSTFIENIYNNDTIQIEYYHQYGDQNSIKKVTDFNDKPVSVTTSFIVIKLRKNKQIIQIAEYPHSESGDWDLCYQNYFDNKGNLIGFFRICSFFNGVCAELVKEKSEYFYDSKHRLIKKTYQIKDGNDNALDYKNCILNYRFDYEKYMTLNSYLRNKKLKIQK
jgi:hypothetical protein